MCKQHLNVTKEESAKVIVNYEVNKYVAYLVLANGNPIVFKTGFKWCELRDDPEYLKYRDEWNLNVECSNMVLTMRTKELSGTYYR
jgi:hypothetical protein